MVFSSLDDWDSSGLLNRATLEDPSSYMTAGLGLGGGAGAEPSSGARAVSRAQYSMDTDEESVTSDHDHEELRLHNIRSLCVGYCTEPEVIM